MWKKAKAFPSIRKREKTREACAKRSFFLVERVMRSDTKRLFGFFEEKGRAATPASFSHFHSIR
jgi:hypothetical protein